MKSKTTTQQYLFHWFHLIPIFSLHSIKKPKSLWLIHYISRFKIYRREKNPVVDGDNEKSALDLCNYLHLNHFFSKFLSHKFCKNWRPSRKTLNFMAERKHVCPILFKRTSRQERSFAHGKVFFPIYISFKPDPMSVKCHARCTVWV